MAYFQIFLCDVSRCQRGYNFIKLISFYIVSQFRKVVNFDSIITCDKKMDRKGNSQLQWHWLYNMLF